jgi:hypothetical protein
VTLVMEPCGTWNDCPPGITPKKLGVLEKATYVTELIVSKNCLPCDVGSRIPPYPRRLTLDDLVRRFDVEYKLWLDGHSGVKTA